MHHNSTCHTEPNGHDLFVFDAPILAIIHSSFDRASEAICAERPVVMFNSNLSRNPSNPACYAPAIKNDGILPIDLPQPRMILLNSRSPFFVSSPHSQSSPSELHFPIQTKMRTHHIGTVFVVLVSKLVLSNKGSRLGGVQGHNLPEGAFHTVGLHSLERG